jgi:hypothetical protein
VVRLELPRTEEAENARFGLELNPYVVVAGVQQIGRETERAHVDFPGRRRRRQDTSCRLADRRSVKK